jgi:hypothetical protein
MELLQRIDCIILIASFVCFMYFLILYDTREKSGPVYLLLHTRVLLNLSLHHCTDFQKLSKRARLVNRVFSQGV